MSFLSHVLKNDITYHTIVWSLSSLQSWVKEWFFVVYICMYSLHLTVCMHVYSLLQSHTHITKVYKAGNVYVLHYHNCLILTESEWGCNVSQPPSQSVIPTTWMSYEVQHPYHIHRYNRGPPPPPLPSPGMKNGTGSSRLMMMSISVISKLQYQQWLFLYIPLHWFLCYYWFISSFFYLLYVLMYFSGTVSIFLCPRLWLQYYRIGISEWQTVEA